MKELTLNTYPLWSLEFLVHIHIYIFRHGKCALFAFTTCCKENHKGFSRLNSCLEDILGYATNKSSMHNTFIKMSVRKCSTQL